MKYKNFEPVTVTGGRKFKGDGYLIPGGYTYSRGYSGSGIDPLKHVDYVKVWDPKTKESYNVNEEYIQDRDASDSEIEKDFNEYADTQIEDVVEWCREKSSGKDESEVMKFAYNVIRKNNPDLLPRFEEKYSFKVDVQDAVLSTVNWAIKLGYSKPKTVRIAHRALQKKDLTNKPDFDDAWVSAWTKVWGGDEKSIQKYVIPFTSSNGSQVDESDEYGDESDRLVGDIQDFLKDYIENEIYGSPKNREDKKSRLLSAIDALEEYCRGYFDKSNDIMKESVDNNKFYDDIDDLTESIYDKFRHYVEVTVYGGKYKNKRIFILIAKQRFLDSLRELEKYCDMSRESSINESDEQIGWFDEYGNLTRDIPYECVKACTHSGSCDEDVERWVVRLGFEEDLPIEKAREYLKQFGAWESDEIAKMDANTLAKTVLWVFCGYLKEEPDYPLSLNS